MTRNSRKTHICVYYHNPPVDTDLRPAWVLAWAKPSRLGHSIGQPFARYAKRSEAVAERRRIYDERGLYAMMAQSDEDRERARLRREQLKKQAETCRRVSARAREIRDARQCGLYEALELARAEVASWPA